MTLYTDLNIECCAWLGSRVEDESLPPGDVRLPKWGEKKETDSQ